MKKRMGILFLTLCSLMMFVYVVRAESIAVTLLKKEEAIVVGEKFMIKMKLSSLNNYKKMEGFLVYDDTKVQFISADDGISGGGGKLRINIENLLDHDVNEEYEEDYGVVEENPEAEETKRVFQMVFKSLKPGKTIFNFVDGIKIFSENDEEMSVSSTSLDVVIQGKREASSISTLSDLKIADYKLNPDFSKTNFQYSLQVPFKTKKLILSAIPSDEKAGIVVAGNDDFQIGDNLVKLIVTAEDGSETTYELIVTREEEELSKEESLSEKTTIVERKNQAEVVSEEKETKSDEIVETDSKEEQESKEENRKKAIFYAIMGGVGLITFIILKLLLRVLKKMEEAEETTRKEKKIERDRKND